MIRMCVFVMWLTSIVFMPASLFASGKPEPKTYDDEDIKKEIAQKLYWSDFKDVSQINVIVTLGEVTLEGKVNSYKVRETVVKYVLAVRGVIAVVNKLEVVNHKEGSILDEYIKTRIINLINYNSYLDLQDIHLLVENGKVTLDGIVDAYWKKNSINEAIGNVDGLIDIENNLVISCPESVEDNKIHDEIIDAIVRGVGINARGITIQVTGGVVDLAGTVTGWEAYNAIQTAVLYTAGVTGVVDNLTIRNTQAANVAKEKIRQRVQDEITADARIDASQITVTSADGAIVLTGSVPTYNQRIWANIAALRVKYVTRVNNELLVKPLQPINEDTFIRERIEHILKWNCLLQIQDLQLTIEAGFVVLEGVVDIYWKKIEAERMLLNIVGVMDLVNKLVVMPAEKISDKTLVRNLVAAIDRKAAVNISDIDIRISNGVVTLFGVVPSWQARSAAYDAVCYTRGVTEIKNFLVVE